MTDRLPASLEYLLVHNPTLPPPPNASRDDEDAQEEAHVLFYTSRERAASRDRMLRQVGLAKALVNFTEIFTTDQGCDNVHSQAKRMVFVSPEPDFWMHACIDLAKTPKPSKDKSKQPKGKDPPVPTYVYHEDSLHNLALRSHLLRGYEHFKLLHGTFSSILKEHGSEGLRRQLERFFTPWAWKWDVESASEFGTHLGLPLHPLNPVLAPIISSFIKNIPANTIPFVLSPPYTIDTQAPVALYPASLPAYLLYSAPPPNRHVSPREQSKRIDSSKNSRTISGNGRTETNNTLGFFSGTGAGMGEVMNVKKWSWPAALSFGKNGTSSQTKHLDGVDETSKVQTPVENKTPSTPSISSRPNAGQESNAESLTYVEGGVDQHALDDAISSLNSTPDPDGVERSVEDKAKPEAEPSERVQSGTGIGLASNSPSPPTQSGHPFSFFKIFTSEPSDPLSIERRCVLRLSRSQLVFALLMDAGWIPDEADTSLQMLGDKVSTLLEDVQRTIDTEDNRNTSLTAHSKATPSRTKHIIVPNSPIVSSSTGFSSVSPQFFEVQELLARDADTVEVFSRTATSQHWFVARRGLGFNEMGENLQGDAYLESSNKDASLVDADNELVGAVRRWAHTGD